MIGAPRDWGKSKLSVALYVCILLNEGKSQLVIVNGPKGKGRIYRGVMKILRSVKIREKYGDVIESSNKNLGEIDLFPDLMTISASDDPSFAVSTVEGIIGAHPTIVWLEDILQSEAKDSEVNEYLVEEIHNNIILKLSSCIGGTFTRKGISDIYSRLPAFGYLMYVKPAIKKLKGEWPEESDLIYEHHEIDGEIQTIAVGCNIPDGSEFEIIKRPGWSVSWLLMQRTVPELYESFERELQNNPLPAKGLYMQKEWIHHFDTLYNARDFYIAVDPGSGLSASADNFVIMVGALHHGTLYLIDGFVGKLRFPDQMLKIHEFNNRYNEIGRVHTIWIEKIMAQTQLYQSMDYLSNVAPFPPPGTQMSKNWKLMRIDASATNYRNGTVRVKETAPYYKQWRIDFLQYNQKETKSGDSRKDDTIDVVSMFTYMLGHQLYTRETREQKTSEVVKWWVD